MSSHILRIMPEHTFDVHVLRTFKRDLIAVLTQLQTSLPRPNETINHVMYMLNQTFHDVELVYLVWRHERVQTTLQHGFQYARARVTAAVWRRDQGRHPAAFPGVVQALQATGNVPSQPVNHPVDWQANSWRFTQLGGLQFQANLHGATVPPAAAWGTQHVQQYQNPPGRSELPAQLQVGGQTSYAPVPAMVVGQGGGGSYEYAPPPFPPPNWQPPPPVPGSPPVSVEVSRAVTAAISYLEAVNRAINLCIEANAI